MDNSRIEKAIMEYSNTLNTEKDVKTVLESVKAKAEKNYNKETLYKILNCIDITSLHTTDTEKSITEFTEKVNKLSDNYGDTAYTVQMRLLRSTRPKKPLNMDFSGRRGVEKSCKFPKKCHQLATTCRLMGETCLTFFSNLPTFPRH